MDLLRNFMSNSTDIALQILHKKIKSGEDQDPFRAHTARDIDDTINNLMAQFSADNNNNNKKANNNIAHPVDFVLMVLMGERASRISKDSLEELASKQTVDFVGQLEAFMLLRRPEEEKASTPEGSAGGNKNSNKKQNNNNNEDAAQQQQDGNNSSNDDNNNKRPEILNTHMDSDSMTAIGHRFFAIAVRFYGSWSIAMAARVQAIGRRSIFYLNQCINNWRPAAGHLTPAHGAIVEVSLKTHNAFIASQGRLDEPIYEINPNLTGVSIFDYLDFYYFGGLCYASLQRWADSAEMLQQVTLAPARGLSVRTIAAVKAHLLVTCILFGDGSTPDNMRMGRYLSDLCRDYIAFCEHVSRAVSAKTFDPSQFDPHLPRDAATDGLLALAQQALTSIPYHRARNLTRTYLTVSLSALGNECGGTEALAEARVREMVLNKQLDCTIDRANKVVTFSDNPTTTASSSSTSATGNCYDATTEEQALKNVMEVNRVVASRQDVTLLSPGHVLSMTPNIPQAVEMTKKEMESEKGGLLSAFRR